MKKILATAAVLAFAGAASAAPNPFLLNGAVEASGGLVAGGFGSSLVWDGSADWGPFGGQWFGPAFTNTGFQFEGANGIIQPTILDGSEQNAGSFRGAVFFGGTGVPSLEVDALGTGELFSAVKLMHLGPGLTNVRLADDAPEGGQDGKAYIQIDSVEQFVGFGAPNENGYSLFLTDLEATGGQILWLVRDIPTPGAAGLLGLAGLAAVRRRR
jgi:hypothetical protein